MNLFVGSRIHVGEVAGTPVEVVQETNYPWNGAVAITRQSAGRARVRRARARAGSQDQCAVLAEPAVKGICQLRVNGETHRGAHRAWLRRVHARVEAAAIASSFELPLTPQRVTADSASRPRGEKSRCVTGRCFTTSSLRTSRASIAQSVHAPLAAEWRGDLLGGVVTLKGKWDDGSALTAVPNFVRMNRGEITAREYPTDEPLDKVYSQVWMKA